MTGDSSYNQMTAADIDLFATLTMLCEGKGIDWGFLHTCRLDSMGYRFFHDCEEMDDACYRMDEALANFLHRWLAKGYEVIVTADHGRDARCIASGTPGVRPRMSSWISLRWHQRS